MARLAVSIFLLYLAASCVGQNTKIRATNGVVDFSSEAYFCFQSTSDPSNNVTDLAINYADVSPYFFLNVSTSWTIGIYSLAGCQSDSLLATTNVTLDPKQTYTVSFVGLIANDTEAIVLYGYTPPPKADVGTCVINFYFQAQNTSSVNLALFLPGASGSSLSLVESVLYASTGYQVSDTLGELRTDVSYDFIEEFGSITGVVVRQNYTFSEQTSYSIFALGILDYFDYDLKVVIVVDDSDSSSNDVDNSSPSDSALWVWILVVVGVIVILAVVILIPVCIVVLVLRNRKHASYQQFQD